jgi:hypothetical protein
MAVSSCPCARHITRSRLPAFSQHKILLKMPYNVPNDVLAHRHTRSEINCTQYRCPQASSSLIYCSWRRASASGGRDAASSPEFPPRSRPNRATASVIIWAMSIHTSSIAQLKTRSHVPPPKKKYRRPGASNPTTGVACCHRTAAPTQLGAWPSLEQESHPPEFSLKFGEFLHWVGKFPHFWATSA